MKAPATVDTMRIHAPETRPFEELTDSGLLWLINTTTFMPRGFVLGLVLDASGKVEGWTLLGDGSEPGEWLEDMQDRFESAERTLQQQRQRDKR